MLDPSQKQAASDLLYAHWMAGERLDRLPEAALPHNRAEAYAVQALLEAQSTHPLFGWKIAATSQAGQAHIGVSGPLAGRILHERVLAPGATASLAGNQMRVAEIEFAFRMGATLPPRATPYTVDEVVTAVEALHPAIEVPDSRYTDFVRAGECQLIADNACAHQFMLGVATDAPWRALDLAAYEVPTLLVRGGETTHLVGLGANVLGDPRLALTWIANELAALGTPLRKGHVVTTGTCLTPIAVQPGDRVRADFGALGTIAIEFAE